MIHIVRKLYSFFSVPLHILNEEDEVRATEITSGVASENRVIAGNANADADDSLLPIEEEDLVK